MTTELRKMRARIIMQQREFLGELLETLSLESSLTRQLWTFTKHQVHDVFVVVTSP